MTAPFSGGMNIIRPRPLEARAGSDVGLCLMSDIHLGAANADMEMIKQELAIAREHNDRVLVDGDLFDMILPGDLKRFQPSCLHERIRGRDDIQNALLEWAIELFAPVAHLLDMVGNGNHESQAVRRHHADLVLLLVNALNDRLEAKGLSRSVNYGGYCGMVLYDMICPGDRGRMKTVPQAYSLFYHHGWGKGSSLRSAAGDYSSLQHLEGIDLFWLGHLHARLAAHTYRLSPPLAGGHTPREREVRFVRTGAYLHSYTGQPQQDVHQGGRKTNYASEAGLASHGRGGATVVLSFADLLTVSGNALPSFKVRVVQ